MRRIEKRLVIALLTLASACSDAGDGPEGDDSDPGLDEDFTQEESPSTAEEGDGGRKRDASSGRDAASRDARADQEPDDEADAGAMAMEDGGRRRRDGGTEMPRDSGQTPSGNDEIPAGEHCAPTADWDPAWTAFEDEVLRLTNEARARGHNCDSAGNFGPTGPLVMEPRLRCAARLYAKMMVEHDHFDHDGPDGSTVGERLAAAGYSGYPYGENIAAGQRTPADVVAGWLDSDGHCGNIMNPSFGQIGIGYYPRPSGSSAKYRWYWTQNFGPSKRS